MPERHAIYYAPGAADPLWVKAAQWLGRDPASGRAVDGPLPGIEREMLTPRSIAARRYGFHATVKAPMALADGRTPEELEQALAEFAAAAAPVPIGQMQLALIGGGFLALIPVAQGDALTGFAAEVVESFDPFRAPPSEAERARRLNGSDLTPRQLELIERFGYPYVLEEFQFHMTLTDRLDETDRLPLKAAAAEHFGPLASSELVLDRLVLFHEPEPGAPFRRGREFMLSGGAKR